MSHPQNYSFIRMWGFGTVSTRPSPSFSEEWLSLLCGSVLCELLSSGVQRYFFSLSSPPLETLKESTGHEKCVPDCPPLLSALQQEQQQNQGSRKDSLEEVSASGLFQMCTSLSEELVGQGTFLETRTPASFPTTRIKLPLSHTSHPVDVISAD